jgi:hypothetical protein
MRRLTKRNRMHAAPARTGGCDEKIFAPSASVRYSEKD